MIAITIEELDDIQMMSTSKVTRRHCVGGQQAIAGGPPANSPRRALVMFYTTAGDGGHGMSINWKSNSIGVSLMVKR